MSKCINCLKEINEKEVFCLTCHEEVLKCAKNKISDLEAKLAESERKLEEYKKCNCKECMTDYEKNLNQIIDKFLNENIKLKQQLAEKDQTIETILKENEELVKKHNVYTWGDEIQQDKIYAITGEALEFLISNQDKISFAIEQLEKVKKEIENADNNNDIYIRVNDFEVIDEIFYKQIKELKEGK